MIYNEIAMIFSALYVVIPLFQRLSCDIANFTFFRQKSKKYTAFLSFFAFAMAPFLAITMNDLWTIYERFMNDLWTI